MIMKRLAPVLLLVSVLLGGCATDRSNIGGFNLISLSEEKQLGDQFAAEIEKQQTVVTDPEIQQYVERVGKRLLTGAQDVKFDYTFKVVQDDTINAFAIPGGHTYVQTGLLKAAENENELAAVMAHEISHVVARHGTKMMTQQYGYALILQLVLGQNPNQLAQIAAALFGKAGSMAYSREMENQADYLGVETMSKAGFDPQGMVTFFQKLEQAKGGGKPPALFKFFSSHPDTVARIAEVRKAIDSLPPALPQPVAPEEFKKIKAKLK